MVFCGDGGGRSPESGGDSALEAKEGRGGGNMEKRKGKKRRTTTPPISFLWEARPNQLTILVMAATQRNATQIKANWCHHTVASSASKCLRTEQL